MKKILLAIDAVNLNNNALEFACYLARLTRSKLTGVFLENLVAEERPVLRQVYGMPYIDHEPDDDSPAHHSRMEKIDKNISFFKDGCTNREVNCRVHRDGGIPAAELIRESRFADILVVDAETSFNKRFEGYPTEFVKDVLKNAECPVIIAPEHFDRLDEIIFAYNGGASSVFAIKQFSNLFPELQHKKVIVMQVNHKGKWEEEEQSGFEEWLKEHYSDYSFEAMKGESDSRLLEFLMQRKNSFLVMGAYGRNIVSLFFKPSHADLLIKTTSQPIFIAHC